MLERVRRAPDRTRAAGSARIWTTTFQAENEPPAFVSVGLVDFVTRSARLEARESAAQTPPVSHVLGSSPSAGGRMMLQEAEGFSQVELFVDDQLYSRAGSGQRWVGAECQWWEHPLLALDLLATVATEVRIGAVADVRGVAATEYIATISGQELARSDANLARHFFGRRLRGEILVRVWLDEHMRAVRIWWSVAPKRRGESLQWTATEFWDFGVKVELHPPADGMIDPPATAWEVIRELKDIQREPNL